VILVIGETGTIGRPLVDILVNEGAAASDQSLLSGETAFRSGKSSSQPLAMDPRSLTSVSAGETW